MAAFNFRSHTKGIRLLLTQEDMPFLVAYKACYIVFQSLRDTYKTPKFQANFYNNFASELSHFGSNYFSPCRTILRFPFLLITTLKVVTTHTPVD